MTYIAWIVKWGISGLYLFESEADRDLFAEAARKTEGEVQTAEEPTYTTPEEVEDLISSAGEKR